MNTVFIYIKCYFCKEVLKKLQKTEQEAEWASKIVVLFISAWIETR
jgi:hypothetical protein